MTNEQIITFLKAGKATFTLESLKTGKHYTFRANRSGDTPIFISLLVAPDDYQYLGTIFTKDAAGNPSPMKYRVTKKSPANQKPHLVMKFFLGCLNFDTDMESRGLIFRHEGKCAVCNRPLTTPESIDIGIGPVCREKL